MTFGFFVLGSLFMLAGFMMVWQTAWFDNNWGDIGAMVGIRGSSLSSWKIAGIIFLFVGFLVAFGILQDFFYLTVGQFIPAVNR